MQRPIRLGVIGCGTHARRSHVAVGRDFVVTAVFDPSLESLEELGKIASSNLVLCASPDELVDRSDVEAVLIASPDITHPELLELAVNAGKPVLCEKPLAISEAGLAVVGRALTQAEQQGLVVASCHPRRDCRNTDLAYGWIKANFGELAKQFGVLERIGLHSSYPRPWALWKEDRSLLLDKFVHDIDYLRFLLGDLSFTAERLVDSHDHYEVVGEIQQSNHAVMFSCLGTRLHGAKDEFIEIIVLTFEHGSCTVYVKTGRVRYWDRRSNVQWALPITPMTSEGYDRVFTALMRDFAEALDGGPVIHSFDELRVISESAIALAGPQSAYQYSTS